MNLADRSLRDAIVTLTEKEEANTARLERVEATVVKIHKVLDMAFSRFEVLTQNPLFMSLMGATTATARTKSAASKDENCSNS